jgi:hypothetical protein
LNVPLFPLSLSRLAVRRGRAARSAALLEVAILALFSICSQFSQTKSLARLVAANDDSVDREFVPHGAIQYPHALAELQDKDS